MHSCMHGRFNQEWRSNKRLKFPPKILFTLFPPLNFVSTVTKQVQKDFMFSVVKVSNASGHLPSSQVSCFSSYFFSNSFSFSSFVLFPSVFLFREQPVLMFRTQVDRHKPVFSHRAPPLGHAAGITGQEQPLERWWEDTPSKFLPGSLMKGGAHYLQGE